MSHPYATILDAVEVVQAEARPTPEAHAAVCPYCFGAKGPDYSQCFGCLQMYRSGASRDLLRRVLPVTIAPSPGAWYSRMQRYKAASPDDMYVVAAAAYVALTKWELSLSELLGGPPDALCIVPSTKGIELSTQRLGTALSLVQTHLPTVEPLLKHRAGEEKPRNSINHRLFIAEDSRVRGRRIVLVEDTWVTGSGAMAAACALETAGAASIAILPIARRVETQSIKNLHGPDYSVLLESRLWRADTLRWPRD